MTAPAPSIQTRSTILNPATGQPFTRQRVAPTRPVGVGGAVLHSGYLYENEKSSDLRGTRKYETLSELLTNVSIIAASVRYFLTLVAKPTWKVEPADDSPEAERIAEAFESIIYGMDGCSWSGVVKRSALHKLYGFDIQVWTAKKLDDGTVGLAHIKPRPQRTIEKWDVIHETGEVRGAIQRDPQDFREIYIPRDRMVYAVDDALNDTPEGLGLLRHAVDPATRLRRLKNLEAIGYETDLRGIPVLRAPLGLLDEMERNGEITAAQKAQYLSNLTTFGENHIKSTTSYVLLDSMTYESLDESATPSAVRKYDFELATGNGQGHEAIHNAIIREIHEIARIFGTEDLLIGSDGQGSMALAKSKTHKFRLLVDSANGENVEVYERDLVPPIAKLNGWPKDLWPCLKPEKTQHEDVEQIAATLRDMAIAGAPIDPTDPVVNAVRDLVGLPYAMQDEGAAIVDSMVGGNRERREAKPETEEQMQEAVEDDNEDRG